MELRISIEIQDLQSEGYFEGAVHVPRGYVRTEFGRDAVWPTMQHKLCSHIYKLKTCLQKPYY